MSDSADSSSDLPLQVCYSTEIKVSLKSEKNTESDQKFGPNKGDGKLRDIVIARRKI